MLRAAARKTARQLTRLSWDKMSRRTSANWIGSYRGGLHFLISQEGLTKALAVSDATLKANTMSS